MCLLILGFHQFPRLPVVLAANRDEFYARPTAPPQLLKAVPRILGGRDARAGGTWLAVNEYGVVVAVTNRHGARPEVPDLPSRGQLCLAALDLRTAEQAARFAAEMDREWTHNPFNLVAVDRESAWLVSNIDAPEPRRLAPGWRIIANQGLDDPTDARGVRASSLVSSVKESDGVSLAESLATVCRDHGAGRKGLPDLCIHGESAGTRSSTILTIATDGRITYHHSEGPPCRTAYERIEIPWQ